jgi:hypothetical protein
MSERAQFGLLIFGLFFGALAFSTIIVVVFARFLALLQMKYPEKWESLGRPTILPTTIRDTARLGAFIIGREYKNLNDQQLKRLGDGLFAIILLFVVLAIVLEMFTYQRNEALL